MYRKNQQIFRRRTFLENLEEENLEYIIIGEFLADLKKNLEKKITNLKNRTRELNNGEVCAKVEKNSKRKSSFKRRLLIEEFKRVMNRVIGGKL